MSESEVLPEVKEIVGAMLFAAKEPLSVPQLRATFPRAAANFGGLTKQFKEVKDADIKQALQELQEAYGGGKLGLVIVEVAKGYRLQNEQNVGPWIRELLEKGKANRLSRPALETLSIIAYRQPCTRSEIEAVRGVAVDQLVRNLLEMGLVKVVGRSEQPGRPWLFGTTRDFLEHFGLKKLGELPQMAELKRKADQLTIKLEEEKGREEAREAKVEKRDNVAVGTDGADGVDEDGFDAEGDED
jgi:segregation and condensation protein B